MKPKKKTKKKNNKDGRDLLGRYLRRHFDRAGRRRRSSSSRVRKQ